MTRLGTAVLMAALTVMGCDGGDGGPAGVDGTKQISAATMADKEALCAWVAPKLGGYGTSSPCADAFIEAPADEADCLSGFPSCAVTVAQFQRCIETIVAAQTTCTPQSLSGAMANADCQAVGLAGCFN